MSSPEKKKKKTATKKPSLHVDLLLSCFSRVPLNCTTRLLVSLQELFISSYFTGALPGSVTRRVVGHTETIDNVLYTYYMLTKIKWYYSEGGYWKDVKGLESLPNMLIAGGDVVRLVDYGGKMVVLWDRLLPSKEKVISCAVISLERSNNYQEIWGKIEWLEGVLTVPDSYKFVCALAPIV